MLGAASYVTYRCAVAENPLKNHPASAIPSLAAPSSLLPAWIERRHGSTDLLRGDLVDGILWNMVSPLAVTADRGVILERDWTALRYPLICTVWRQTGRSRLSIFAPMLVEDGRRLSDEQFLELSSGTDGWASSPII